MTSLFGGREREAPEWELPFALADKRYKFHGVREASINKTGIPTKKLLSIIEASWDPDC